MLITFSSAKISGITIAHGDNVAEALQLERIKMNKTSAD